MSRINKESSTTVGSVVDRTLRLWMRYWTVCSWFRRKNVKLRLIRAHKKDANPAQHFILFIPCRRHNLLPPICVWCCCCVSLLCVALLSHRCHLSISLTVKFYECNNEFILTKASSTWAAAGKIQSFLIFLLVFFSPLQSNRVDKLCEVEKKKTVKLNRIKNIFLIPPSDISLH